MVELITHPLAQFVGLLVVFLVVRLPVRKSAAYKLAADIAFFAAFTVLLLRNGIAPYLGDDPALDVADRFAYGGLKAIWWIGGAMMLTSLVRLFLIFEGKPREVRLLQDVVVALIYISAALSIITYVFSLPIGTIIATSGIFAIILGLALQNTLSDVFSGIALNLGHPISPGHWIVLDGDVQGQVFETTWRSTQIRTATNDVVFIPNSLLARSRFTNTSYPDRSHGATLRIRLRLDRPPRAILELMNDVLLSSGTIEKDPAPTAIIAAIDKDIVDMDLAFRVSDVGKVGAAKNELFDLIYRHVESVDLQLASSLPISSDPSGRTSGEKSRAGSGSRKLLNAIRLFSSLTEDEKDGLATSMRRLNFLKGEIIAHHNAALTSLIIIKSGVVVVEEPDGETGKELDRLAPGDLFGEGGVLLGAVEVGEKRALTPVVAYEIAKEKLANLLKERPAIAEELAELLSARTQRQEALHQVMATGAGQNKSALAARMRQLFHLTHNR